MIADDPFEDDEAGYWPGYVDALTNIVLNLLFMVGVFAVGVFAVSLEARLHHRRQAVPEAPPVVVSPRTSLPRPMSLPTPVPLPAPSPPTSASAPAAVADPVPAETVISISAPTEAATSVGPNREVTLKFGDSRGNPIVQAIFPGDRFALTDAEDIRIHTWLREQQARGVRDFLLFTSVDESDAQDRRAGYLRIMAVRSSLLRAGLAPTSLSTRMFRGEQRELAANRQVTIVPGAREPRH